MRAITEPLGLWERSWHRMVKTFHGGGWSVVTVVLLLTSEQNRRDVSVPRVWKSVMVV